MRLSTACGPGEATVPLLSPANPQLQHRGLSGAATLGQSRDSQKRAELPASVSAGITAQTLKSLVSKHSRQQPDDCVDVPEAREGHSSQPAWFHFSTGLETPPTSPF